MSMNIQTNSIQAVWQSWSPPIAVNVSLCLGTLIYVRGWLRLHKPLPNLISAWPLFSFLVGVVAIWFAIGSPLSALDDVSLTVHMVQHLFLMAIAPPLILAGAPALPLLQGLPQVIARRVFGPLLRSGFVKSLAHAVTHPVICWLAATLTLVVWHIPSVFELALRWDWLHEIEHASFLATGLLFWWPVIQPWPSTLRCPRWSIPLYLFGATLPCDALSGFLVFCDRVVYSSYLSVPKVFNLSPLQDQQFAAALMWTSITIIFLVPAAVVTIGILSPQETLRPDEALSEFHRITRLPLVSTKLEAN